MSVAGAGRRERFLPFTWLGGFGRSACFYNLKLMLLALCPQRRDGRDCLRFSQSPSTPSDLTLHSLVFLNIACSLHEERLAGRTPRPV